MTREFLKENATGITDEQISNILNEIGKEKAELQQQLDTAKQELANVTTERDGLNEQIIQRDKDIKDLQKKCGDNQALTEQLTALQTKYDNDTKELQGKLESQAFAHSAEKLFADYEFSSEYARKAIYAEFESQKFERDEDGNLKGAKEWMESIKEQSPDAFKTVESEPKPNPEPDPQPNLNPPTPAPYFAARTNNEPKKPTLLEQMIAANNAQKK